VRSATDPIAANGLRSYVRNKLDQLTGDGQTGGTNPTTLGLGYDSAYQLTSRSNSAAGTSSTYTMDNADELTGLTTTTNGATTQNLSFTYDRNGDRLSVNDSVSGSSLSYTYDQENRLTSAISGTTTLASYSYDGDGLRQSKTVGSTTTTFTWDQSGSLPLLLQAGSTSYIDGPDGHPIEQITGSTPSYYLYDALGSVRGVLSATGGYTGYSYDAYGTIPSGNRPTGDYFGFAGEYTDAETGFEYLQARYYDPNTGEFISVDPLKDLTDQPYAYAGDNPLSATDPTGLTSCGWLQWACDAQTAIVDFLTNPGSPETTAALNKANDELDLGTSLDKLHDYIRNSPPGKDTYIALLFASGIFDGLTFNQYSHLAQAFGVTIASCSSAYEAWQTASIGINLVLVIASGGTDEEADAAEIGVIRGRWIYRPTRTGTPALPAGEGVTDPFGNITYSNLGTAEDQALALYHEMVHSWFSPRIGPFRVLRAKIIGFGYNNSSLLRYLEEALAESHARVRVRGLSQLGEALIFPIVTPFYKITVRRLIAEGTVAVVTIGGVLYGVYLLPTPRR
jgi:RHS repeat-associated protein